MNDKNNDRFNKGKFNKNNLTEILHSGHKGVNKPMSPISKLIRIILSDLNIRPHQFNNLLKNYLNDPMNGFDSPEAKSSENSNIKKEFSRENSTFKTLVKLIKVLNPLEIEFSVKFKWHNGKETSHKTSVVLQSFNDADALNMITITNPVPNKPKTTIEEINKAIEMLNDDGKNKKD